ncbi:MAG: PQQ-binding-like beta-propeller repeat protein [Planctomycetes bacterium]|nr:PQQ-binding-like beta-propeller repeat protein [Planctomycetota bacterium]
MEAAPPAAGKTDNGGKETADFKALAAQFSGTKGVRPGLWVHVGCGGGKLAAELPQGGRNLVHGVDADRAKVEEARKHIQSRGIYGQVSVECRALDRLPYTHDTVNVLIVDRLDEMLAKGFKIAEAIRVLAPYGVAFLGGSPDENSLKAKLAEAGVKDFGIVRENGVWAKVVKPYPAEMDEWPQYLNDGSGADTSKDKLVGPPTGIRWLAGDAWPRGVWPQGIFSANGRNFYIFKDKFNYKDGKYGGLSLVCRDAFNGHMLWQRPLEMEPGSLAAEGDRLYMALKKDGPVTALDAASGQIIKTYEFSGDFVYRKGVLILTANRGLEARNAESGAILWKNEEGLSQYVIGDDRIALLAGDKIVSLDIGTGKEQWRVPAPAGKLPDRRNRWGGLGNAKALVYHKGMLFVTTLCDAGDASGPPATMHALSGTDGKRLWSRPLPVPDIYSGASHFFCLDEYVWAEDLDLSAVKKGEKFVDKTAWVGLDPATGEVKKRLDFRFYHRCFGNRATGRYILYPEMHFVDVKEGKIHQFFGGRGSCSGAGFVPANGLVYQSANGCGCYSHLHEFAAFSPDAPPATVDANVRSGERLEKGPAFGGVPASAPPREGDWPTLRHDTFRSGSTKASVPADLKALWQAKVGGAVSGPVVADGKVIVASIDEHRVAALDAEKGELLWSYTAGARVDSPPTIFSGLAIFGSRDGYVYCLKASDGALVWRFRAAPEDRRIMVRGQLESAWPVFGSVLMEKGAACFAAGRHTETDGGIFLYAADPPTGKILWEERITLKAPFQELKFDERSPRSACNDVLVSDGKLLFLDGVGIEPETRKISVNPSTVGALWGGHAGMLDDKCQPPTMEPRIDGRTRTNWHYVSSLDNFGYRTFKNLVGTIASGDLLAVDGHRIFSASHGRAWRQGESRAEAEKFMKQNPSAGRIFMIRPAAENEKTNASSAKLWRGSEKAWSIDTPEKTLIKAMIVAGDKVFAACRPGGLAPETADSDKGEIRIYSAADGKELGQIVLDARPRYDGMAATEGRLYVATEDGKILCLGKK